jgi:hypothetical protein
MVRLLMLSGLFLLLAALAAPTASAGTREKILRECQEGSITGNYTPEQLRDARKNIPTDIDEYSDCRDVLSRAALAGRDSGGGGGGGGGTAAPGGVLPGGGGGSRTYAAGPDEEKDLEKALLDAPAGATVDGDKLVPGASGLAADAARHGIPTSLLTALILFGLCALAAAAPTVRRRVLARRKS